MILIFLGAPRTASNSLWNFFHFYKNISCSVEKEPFNNSRKRVLFITDRYLNWFNITDNTEFLLDGTPAAYSYYHNIVKRIKYPIKIIYPLRDPYDRLYSQIKQILITHYYHHSLKSHTFPDFIKGKLKINKDEIINIIPSSLDSFHLEHAFRITSDVLIIKFEDMIADMSPVFDFLGVRPLDKKLPHRNKMTFWNEKKYNLVRNEVDSFFYKNDELDRLIKEDSKKLLERYGISR